MAEIMLVKNAQGGFFPADSFAEQSLEKIKVGTQVRCEITRVRNAKFHRKFFALLNTTFEMWEPLEIEWNGVQAEKDFDTFREQVTILAGYHDVVVTLKGDARVRAKSISFGKMDDIEFEKVYSNVFAVCWKLLMKQSDKWSAQELERVINEMGNYV